MAIGQRKWIEARAERKRLLRSLRSVFKRQRRRAVLKAHATETRYTQRITQHFDPTSYSPLEADRLGWVFEYRGNPRQSR